MEIDVIMLGPAIVNAQRKLIQKTAEGFIMNAASNITQIGGTATDLLRSTPTVNNRYHKADTRAILFTFAYTFNSAFKEKLMENKFSREY